VQGEQILGDDVRVSAADVGVEHQKVW